MGLLYSCGELMNTRNRRHCLITFSDQSCGISYHAYGFHQFDGGYKNNIRKKSNIPTTLIVNNKS